MTVLGVVTQWLCVLSLLFVLIRGERVYEEVVFSAETCKKLGEEVGDASKYTADFDVCAVLVFCHSGRRLQDDPFPGHGESTWDTEATSTEEADATFMQQEQKSERNHDELPVTDPNDFENNESDESDETHEEEEEETPGDEMDTIPQPPVTPSEEQQQQQEETPVTVTGKEGGMTQQPPVTPEVVIQQPPVEPSESESGPEEEEEETPGDEMDTIPQPPVTPSEQQQQEETPVTPGVVIQQPPVEPSESEFGPGMSQQEESLFGGMEEQEPEYPQARYGWRLETSTECTYPGPVMRLERGLKHGLFVRNSGIATTNLHFHGLHIAGHGNSDGLHRRVEPANTIIYAIDLPANQHMGGTHWYHSHFHGQSFEQTKGGAFGMIVVNDGDHDVGTSDPNVLEFLNKERLLILDDTNGRQSWHANGKPMETYEFQSGDWYRLRVLVVGTNGHTSSVPLSFSEGCDVHAVAHDGIFRMQVPKATAQNAFSLTPSSRLDVAIRCRSDGNIMVKSSTVASIQVVPNSSSSGPSSATPFESGTDPWPSNRLEYTKDLRDVEVENVWDIHVYETNINQISYGANTPLCNNDGNDFAYGSVQEWRLGGTYVHPFHSHMFPMQIVSQRPGDCGDAHEFGEFYDSIITASTRTGTRRNACKVRVHLVDVAGPAVVHCHIFEHAEHGALGWFNVVDGPIQPDTPRVHACAANTCDKPIQFPLCHNNNHYGPGDD